MKKDIIQQILDFKATDFQKSVWLEIAKIPKGKVITYKDIAIAIDKPKASRAVANAVGDNPFPIIVPCHRVVRSDGKLGGYSGEGGAVTKRRLLKEEGIDY